jgi:hypothetical protein
MFAGRCSKPATIIEGLPRRLRTTQNLLETSEVTRAANAVYQNSSCVCAAARTDPGPVLRQKQV